MDYLQEGINLRAMGQKDPLVEWQREGFEMFGQMMQGIAQDFVQLRHARPGHRAAADRARGRHGLRRPAATAAVGGDEPRCRTCSTPRPTTRAGGGDGRRGPAAWPAEGGPAPRRPPWPTSPPR